ncbi:protein of unknown function [Kyrpidia spormannii]|uniref:Uncharacterized protein n=1 Tax=Kyrpidia spormannii TaxID=2055160 RepID=A0A6F9EFP9_9BACL|nr:protein of unknown function [Kyrpidia spormannii]
MLDVGALEEPEPEEDGEDAAPQPATNKAPAARTTRSFFISRPLLLSVSYRSLTEIPGGRQGRSGPYL